LELENPTRRRSQSERYIVEALIERVLANEGQEYVVEFDGPHDPLHAQNWSLKKK